LSDETIIPYVWLLEAFLEAMHQRHPRSLIIDGDTTMARAMEIVLPNADHRLCSWLIEQNMLKRFRGVKLSNFRKFIYSAMEEGEFDRLWKEFRANHNIKQDNLWVNMMYQQRRKWAATFTRGRYFLGMQSNQRSESLNSRLHNHLDRKMSLVWSIMSSAPFTKISADELEKSAAQTFTPVIFRRVIIQIRKGYNLFVREVVFDNGSLRYEVAMQSNSQWFFHVACTFRSSLADARSHCRKMEREGIPCAHISFVHEVCLYWEHPSLLCIS